MVMSRARIVAVLLLLFGSAPVTAFALSGASTRRARPGLAAGVGRALFSVRSVELAAGRSVELAAGRSVELAAGAARARFSVREPAGYIQRLAITAPAGMRAAVSLVIPQVAAVGLSVPVPAGSAESCRREGTRQTCVVPLERCPMPKATWRVELSKPGGPAALIRLQFLIHRSPLGAASAA